MEVYPDGGCEPNPGPRGYGVVLLHPKKRAEVSPVGSRLPKLHQIFCLKLSHGTSGGFRLTTNKRMKILATIAGLEMLKQLCHGIGVARYRTLRGSAAEGKVPS